MGLTGGPFIVFVTLVAIAVVVVAVRLLGRFPGRTARDVAARAGLVIATQVAVLFAVLVAVNSWGEFYATWGDLLGADHSRAQVKQHSKKTNAAFSSLSGSGSHLKTSSGQGRIDVWTLRGPRSGLSTSAYVVVPSQYVKEPTRRFPAVLVLSADPKRLATEINPEVYQAVYVVLNPATSGCVDTPGGPQAETFLTQDVPQGVTAVQPIAEQGQSPAPDPSAESGYRLTQQWGVIGDASSGYCTTKLVLDRSDRFVAAASLGTSYAAPEGNYYGGSAAYKDQNTLLWRLKNDNPQPPGSLMLANNAEAQQLQAAAQDPLHIEAAPDGASLPDSLPTLQKWIESRLAPLIGNLDDPNAPGNGKPGALPAQGGGFKGHRGQP